MDSAGNVGNGTTSPGVKLDVAGIVKASKFSGDGSGLTGIIGLDRIPILESKIRTLESRISSLEGRLSSKRH